MQFEDMLTLPSGTRGFGRLRSRAGLRPVKRRHREGPVTPSCFLVAVGIAQGEAGTRRMHPPLRPPRQVAPCPEPRTRPTRAADGMVVHARPSKITAEWSIPIRRLV